MNRYQLMKRMLPGKSIRALLLIIATGGLTDLAAADSTSNPEFCTGCHDDQPMKGVHAGTLFGPTNKVAACIDCHGDVRDLALHEKDASDVIRFSVEANTKIANNSCLACHKPDGKSVV